MNYDFSKRVDDLLRRERRTKKSLYEHLNMSSQGFDAMMRNNSFTASRLGDVANFFGISIAEFYSSEMSDTKERQEVAGGDAYLQDHLVSLEENFKKLLEQLQVKDQQIAGLQRTVDALVGKSEGVTLSPLSPEEIEFHSRYNQYNNLVLNNEYWLANQNYQFPAIPRK